MFHDVSRNPFLEQKSIDIHPDALSSSDELRQRAWQFMEPRYLARLAALVEEFGHARSKGLGDDELAEVAEAVVGGGVDTLPIEARREVSGRIDAATSDIEFGDLTHPEVDDVLDDLGTLALKMGGQVSHRPHRADADEYRNTCDLPILNRSSDNHRWTGSCKFRSTPIAMSRVTTGWLNRWKRW